MRQVEKDTAAALGLSVLVSAEYLLAQKEHLPGRKKTSRGGGLGFKGRVGTPAEAKGIGKRQPASQRVNNFRP